MSLRSVVVFGSINMDLVAQVPRLPKPGETLLGSRFSTVPGGKGANQAVGAARLNAPTQMIGQVGDDGFGQELIASLEAAGVDVAGVSVDRTTASGVAMIAVDESSENHIIVVPGANGTVGGREIDRLRSTLTTAAALLLQLEIPISAVQSAAEIAHAAGVLVILDPAPAQSDLSDELYKTVDILTPNATEAEQLVGRSINSRSDAEQAAQTLQQRGAKTVIVKLGAEGAVCATPEDCFFVPAFAVNAIDTVAAGDAFNAALAVAITEGKSMREAVRWGAAAGALAATKSGAQASLSDRATFDAFLERH